MGVAQIVQPDDRRRALAQRLAAPGQVAAERAGEPLGCTWRPSMSPNTSASSRARASASEALSFFHPRRTAAVPGSMPITCRDRSVLGGGVPCLERQNKMKSGRPPSEKE